MDITWNFYMSFVLLTAEVILGVKHSVLLINDIFN